MSNIAASPDSKPTRPQCLVCGYFTDQCFSEFCLLFEDELCGCGFLAVEGGAVVDAGLAAVLLVAGPAAVVPLDVVPGFVE
jgi:hypothetical protein